MKKLNKELSENIQNIKIVVGIKTNFSNVLGADCFIEQFPTLFTIGIQVCKLSNGLYYIVKDNKIVHDSSFFSQEEIDNHFKAVII